MGHQNSTADTFTKVVERSLVRRHVDHHDQEVEEKQEHVQHGREHFRRFPVELQLGDLVAPDVGHGEHAETVR